LSRLAIPARGSTGFERCIWWPASSARWRSSARAYRQRDCRNIPRFSVAQRPDLLNQLIAVEVRHADSLTLRNPLMTAFMAVNVLQKTAPAGAERELKRL
jgi:hypothetical protein